MSVGSMMIGGGRDALSGGNDDVGSNVESESSLSDLAVQDAETLLLARDALLEVEFREQQKGAVAAQDWLDISHALFEEANESGQACH